MDTNEVQKSKIILEDLITQVQLICNLVSKLQKNPKYRPCVFKQLIINQQIPLIFQEILISLFIPSSNPVSSIISFSCQPLLDPLLNNLKIITLKILNKLLRQVSEYGDKNEVLNGNSIGVVGGNVIERVIWGLKEWVGIGG